MSQTRYCVIEGTEIERLKEKKIVIDFADIKKLVELIEEGKVVAHFTDTISFSDAQSEQLYIYDRNTMLCVRLSRDILVYFKPKDISVEGIFSG